MRYVFVTGGVVSGLGKGITASSIGLLLKAAGWKVTAIKIGAGGRRWRRLREGRSVCFVKRAEWLSGGLVEGGGGGKSGGVGGGSRGPPSSRRPPPSTSRRRLSGGRGPDPAL